MPIFEYFTGIIFKLVFAEFLDLHHIKPGLSSVIPLCIPLAVYLQRRKYGMNLCTVLWSRLTLGVLSVILLMFYITQCNKYYSDYASLSDKYSKLMVHSSGLSAQLQLLVERNHRAEKLLIDFRAKYNQILLEDCSDPTYFNLKLAFARTKLERHLQMQVSALLLRKRLVNV
uniref:Transmembrane protein n=1 Tax=Elaeophora elaphi TaxID=1147741 RepID=A0A0R3S185_9BILA